MFFAAKQILDMEARVLNVVRKLCRDMHIKSESRMVSEEDEYTAKDGVFDLQPWLNLFSYDAISAMFFTESYGFLDKGNDVCPAQMPSEQITQVHAMDMYHSISIFNGIFATMPNLLARDRKGGACSDSQPKMSRIVRRHGSI